MKTKLILSFLIIVLGFLFINFKTIEYKPNKNKGYYKISQETNGESNKDSTLIYGRIFDLKLQKPLPAAIFKIKDSKIAGMANDSGYFETKVKTGTYCLIFHNVGNTELVTKKIKVDTKNKYHLIVYLDSYYLYEKEKSK